MSDIILHIIPREQWANLQGQPEYEGDTLKSEGFIHFSTPLQVVIVANARFKGHTGLQLLVVDPSKLNAELKYEPPYETNPDGAIAAQTRDQLFPHLFGPLNLDAVIRAVDFEPGEDGFFSLPDLGD